jgi:hypothetical protein
MMNKKTLLGLQGMLLAGAAAFALTGCLTSPDKTAKSDFASDDQSAFLVSEVDQMGQAADESNGPAAKIGIGGLDSGKITGELVIDPFKYDSTCRCFVRRAKFTNSKGYERLRLDSITFVDTNGDTMSVFNRKALGKFYHKRHVTRTKGGNEFDVTFDIQVEVKTEGDNKVGVWNGTVDGTYNGEALAAGSINDVKRVVTNGHYGFPVSGSIEIDRPVFHFLVEFLGDGKAKATIKNKKNGRIHIIWIDVDGTESAPTEQ